VEDPEWTRRYHSADPSEKAFGARVEISTSDGRKFVDELAVADAHPLGARPFRRDNYIAKFRSLTEDVIDTQEQERFLELITRLDNLSPEEVRNLTIEAPDVVARDRNLPTGIF
jgi:2-methylcitrate dehydratase